MWYQKHNIRKPVVHTKSVRKSFKNINILNSKWISDKLIANTQRGWMVCCTTSCCSKLIKQNSQTN